MLHVRCLAIAVAVLAALVAPQSASAEPPPRGAEPTVSGLLTNSLEDPLDIGGEAPRLSWRIESNRRGVMRTAYQVRVRLADDPVVWDSGRVASARGGRRMTTCGST